MGINFSLGGFTEEVKKAIDYWKSYKGQTIRIERVQIDAMETPEKPDKKTKYGVEGTVSEVMALPPGFVLTDAAEFTNPENLNIQPNMRPAKGGSYTEDHTKIFISFESIERIIFVDEE